MTFVPVWNQICLQYDAEYINSLDFFKQLYNFKAILSFHFTSFDGAFISTPKKNSFLNCSFSRCSSFTVLYIFLFEELYTLQVAKKGLKSGAAGAALPIPAFETIPDNIVLLYISGQHQCPTAL